MITYKITGKDGKIAILSLRQLLTELTYRVSSKPKEEHAIVASTVLEFLQLHNAIANYSIGQLCSLLFSLGYYYRVFLEKNTVELEIQKTDESIPTETVTVNSDN